MKKIFALFICLILLCLPVLAKKTYYIKDEPEYELKFLCFSEEDCYNVTPSFLEVKNKKFVGFGDFNYYDLDTYKYNKATDTYNVNVVIERDPSTDSDVIDHSPYDKGYITHLIFSLTYCPSKKIFNASYIGFISGFDVTEYKNGEPYSITTNFIDIYYNNNPKYISDLDSWIKELNQEIPKTFGQIGGSKHDIALEYLIPYALR